MTRQDSSLPKARAHNYSFAYALVSNSTKREWRELNMGEILPVAEGPTHLHTHITPTQPHGAKEMGSHAFFIRSDLLAEAGRWSVLTPNSTSTCWQADQDLPLRSVRKASHPYDPQHRQHEP